MNQNYPLHALAAVTIAGVALIGCSRSDVHETTLDNGLRVVVKEDHRSPVVVSQIWYRVGAVDEPKNLTGISHVLEHMMFKGTKHLKPNEFSRIIAENGGRENAFTSYDYTAYFQQLEKSRLPISFELEADRMRNLTLDADEFAKEIKVVMEERRLRTEDQPAARVYEQFMATAYKEHPYKHPIIGWMEDLKNITVEDVRAWYRRWYTPRNAILVVVGDVKPRDVFALAKKYFGPVPAPPVDPTSVPVEPAQEGARRARVSVPAEVPYMVLGYHAPGYREARRSWEPYALSVLVGVLDGGGSARFARDLVRGRQIAESAGASYSPISRYPTMVLFDGTPANGHTVEELEHAIRNELERLKSELVSEDELNRVKAQVVAQDVYSRDSVFYQAMRIGMLESCGLDWRLLNGYVEQINAVTAQQVRDVARAYLVDDNLTIASLHPKPMPQRGRSAPAPRKGGDYVR